MAIDYDSGTGLFDKVGTVIALTNLLESWQTSTSEGGLEKEMSDLEALLEDDKQFDALAKQALLQRWNTYNSTLNNLKLQLLELTRLFMASEIVDAEAFDQDGLNALAEHLGKLMVRDSESVDASTIGGSYAQMGSAISVLAEHSTKDTNNPSENSSQVLGTLKDDTFVIEISNVTPGQEAIHLYGTNPPPGVNVGHPNWANLGRVLSNYRIRSYAVNNLVQNGSFLSLDSFNRLTQWTPAVGAWGTDFSMVPFATHDLSPVVLRFGDGANGKLTQPFPASRLKPRTKYALIISAQAESESTDGNIVFGLDLHASSFRSTECFNFDSIKVLDTLFFNTEDQVKDCTFFIERESATDEFFYVLGVGLFEMTLTPFGWFICYLANYGNGFLPPTTLGIPSGFVAGSVTNNHGGVIADYFGRYIGVTLPSNSSGSETIDDALAG